jgi:hypothetical protein
MEMIPLRATIFLIGLFIFVAITKLVRNGRLHEKYSAGWFLLGLGILISGSFPHVVDRIASYLGINYPPILPICIGIGFVLVQQLHLFILASRNEARIRQLTQELALLSKLLEERHEAKEKGEA